MEPLKPWHMLKEVPVGIELIEAREIKSMPNKQQLRFIWVDVYRSEKCVPYDHHKPIAKGLIPKDSSE